jgi:hypothetical protein
MKKPRRTLKEVRVEILRSRIADLAAWRLALSKFWRIDLLWAALHFRWVNARRRRALLALSRANMSPDWQDARPAKLRRKLGLLPPLLLAFSLQHLAFL